MEGDYTDYCLDFTDIAAISLIIMKIAWID